MNVFKPAPISVTITADTGESINVLVPSDFEEKIAGMTDERLAELETAFNLVKNAENWKNPIDAFVKPIEVADVVEAIDWYTSSVAVVEYITVNDVIMAHVTADGYYLTIGA